MPDTTHDTTIALLIDDHERLRTSQLRNRLIDVALLDLALDALRNGSPEVTAEYLERTIAHARRDIEALRTA